ncbi:MAG TPA: DUF1287 domain-containing protein [Pyrinomonadaceae bacterium]|nr:DUF1287 domain-containing protein [Pyrinomonadaceae bacterium]
MIRIPTILSILTLVAFAACGSGVRRASGPIPRDAIATEVRSPAIAKLIESGVEQTKTTRSYTQDYFSIGYPDGDVPVGTGACTDVVIRSFRRAGIDLQKEVHEDMSASFSAYPMKWGLTGPDKNIDHRRVPNLQTFFKRRGKSLTPSLSAESYEPGDVVSWDIDGKGMTHIGLVSNLRDPGTGRYLIIHNIGAGVNAEDRLFAWKITGHFRYF